MYSMKTRPESCAPGTRRWPVLVPALSATFPARALRRGALQVLERVSAPWNVRMYEAVMAACRGRRRPCVNDAAAQGVSLLASRRRASSASRPRGRPTSSTRRRRGPRRSFASCSPAFSRRNRGGMRRVTQSRPSVGQRVHRLDDHPRLVGDAASPEAEPWRASRRGPPSACRQPCRAVRLGAGRCASRGTTSSSSTSAPVSIPAAPSPPWRRSAHEERVDLAPDPGQRQQRLLRSAGSADRKAARSTTRGRPPATARTRPGRGRRSARSLSCTALFQRGTTVGPGSRGGVWRRRQNPAGICSRRHEGRRTTECSGGAAQRHETGRRAGGRLRRAVEIPRRVGSEGLPPHALARATIRFPVGLAGPIGERKPPRTARS